MYSTASIILYSRAYNILEPSSRPHVTLLTPPPPVEVRENPEEDHGGHGNGVSALLQHDSIPFNHLRVCEWEEDGWVSE